jgi:hypothetical protein
MAKKVGMNPEDISRGMFLQELEAAIKRAEAKIGRSYGSAQMVADHLGTSLRQMARWRDGDGPTNARMIKLYAKLKGF